jgi:hypothetical protein
MKEFYAKVDDFLGEYEKGTIPISGRQNHKLSYGWMGKQGEVTCQCHPAVWSKSVRELLVLRTAES